MYFIKKITYATNGNYEESYMSQKVSLALGAQLFDRYWDDFITKDTDWFSTIQDADNMVRSLWNSSITQSVGIVNNLSYIDISIDDNNNVDIPIVINGILLAPSVVSAIFGMHIIHDVAKDPVLEPGEVLKKYRNGDVIDWIDVAKKKYGCEK